MAKLNDHELEAEDRKAGHCLLGKARTCAWKAKLQISCSTDACMHERQSAETHAARVRGEPRLCWFQERRRSPMSRMPRPPSSEAFFSFTRCAKASLFAGRRRRRPASSVAPPSRKETPRLCTRRGGVGVEQLGQSSPPGTAVPSCCSMARSGGIQLCWDPKTSAGLPALSGRLACGRQSLHTTPASSP